MNTHYMLHRVFILGKKQKMIYLFTLGIPVGIGVISNDVITPRHQTLIDAS